MENDKPVKKYDWKQLESNPESVNQYLSEIGVDMSIFCFQDLLSTEEWAMQSIMPPVLGLLFIFHYGDEHHAHKKAQNEEIKEKGQHVDDSLFYMKQYAKNACGSVGVYHILANLPEEQRHMIFPDGTLDKFLKACEGKTAKEKGTLFNCSSDVRQSHEKAVATGDTPIEKPAEKDDCHFISFVEHKGTLYELDGGKEFAINHGPTTKDSFLFDACQVAKQFMARDPTSVDFGLQVYAPNPVLFGM